MEKDLDALALDAVRAAMSSLAGEHEPSEVQIRVHAIKRLRDAGAITGIAEGVRSVNRAIAEVKADNSPWEIQGFIDGYGDGRACFTTGVKGVVGVLAYLANDLPDTECTATLIRRGPQLPVADDGTIGPWRLIAVDARERLARWLYAELLSEPAWDQETDRDRDGWLNRADEILAVIAGQES